MQTDVLENETKEMHKITVRTSGDPVASSFILIGTKSSKNGGSCKQNKTRK